jgi:hypothetical protein
MTAGRESCLRLPSERQPSWKSRWRRPHGRSSRGPAGLARRGRPAGGRGKSGGARIIHYLVSRRAVLYLLDVYAKSAKEDLTDAEKHEIRKLIAAIEAQG